MGSALIKILKVLSTGPDMAAVDDSMGKFSIRRQNLLPPSKHVFDFDCSGAPRKGICDIHKPDTVLKIAEFERCHQTVFVPSEDGEERACDFSNLGYSGSNLIAAVLFWIKK